MDFSDFTTWPVSPSMKLRPATFDPEAEAFLGHFSTFSAEMSNLLVELETFQQEINTSEQNAAQAVLDARTELDNCRVEVDHCKTEVVNCKTEVSLARAHADTAYRWAEETKHIEVKPGEYSSKHYMLTAKEFVENLLQDPVFSLSTTPLTIGLGTRALVTAAALSYRPGMWLVLIDKNRPRSWMKGYVDSYDSGTGDLAIQIVALSDNGVQGSDWLISQTNPEIGSFKNISMESLWGDQQYITMGGF